MNIRLLAHPATAVIAKETACLRTVPTRELARIDPRVLRLYRQLLLALLAIGIGCEAAALRGWGVSPTLMFVCCAVRTPFFTLAIGCVFFLHAASRPDRRELSAAVAIGLGAGVLFSCLGPNLGVDVRPAYAVFAGIGAASLGLLAWRSATTRGIPRLRILAVFFPACLIVGSVAIGLYFLMLGTQLLPATYDHLLYAADTSFGTPPCFLVGQLFRAVPVVAWAAHVAYWATPAGFILVFLRGLRTDPSQRSSPIPVFLGAACIGHFVYLFLPAVGPEYVFGSAFPDAPPPAELLSRPIFPGPFARNCMPSMHTVWALLLFWHARRFRGWVRALMAALLVLTLLATLGLGEHYVVDLVVACPFALAAQAAFGTGLNASRRQRLTAGAIGSVLVVAWLLLLRYGPALLSLAGWFSPTAALATVVAAFLLERGLHRSAHVPSFSTVPQPLHPVRHFDEQIAHENQPAAQK